MKAAPLRLMTDTDTALLPAGLAVMLPCYNKRPRATAAIPLPFWRTFQPPRHLYRDEVGASCYVKHAVHFPRHPRSPDQVAFRAVA